MEIACGPAPTSGSHKAGCDWKLEIWRFCRLGCPADPGSKTGTQRKLKDPTRLRSLSWDC